jgi:hypothetical protein
MGWADAAYCRFDVLFHRICEQRQNSVNQLQNVEPIRSKP